MHTFSIGYVDMIKDLAEFLSTATVTVEHRVTTGVNIDG